MLVGQLLLSTEPLLRFDFTVCSKLSPSILIGTLEEKTSNALKSGLRLGDNGLGDVWFTY